MAEERFRSNSKATGNAKALNSRALDAIDQRKEVVDIDAVDDGGFRKLRCCTHLALLCLRQASHSDKRRVAVASGMGWPCFS